MYNVNNYCPNCMGGEGSTMGDVPDGATGDRNLYHRERLEGAPRIHPQIHLNVPFGYLIS